MMRLRGGGVDVYCDFTMPASGAGCGASTRVEPLNGLITFASAATMARADGWRCYVEGHRRDLCPPHYAAARNRVTLAYSNRAAS